MSNSITAYIGLGSNLGDRQKYINDAIKMLNETDGIEITGTSDIIETAPLGGRKQPDYLNGVIEIKTILDAKGLHKRLTEIEKELGRERKEKWAARTIDLDLLVFSDQIINLPELTVPHPQMHFRSFVLNGLCQLNPNLIHPVMKVSAAELASRLNNQNFIPEPRKPALISVAGLIGVGKTTLAKKLSENFGCKLLLEPYDQNPFLPEVYAGRKDLALESQLFFLRYRVNQLSPDFLEAGKMTITDYIFDQEEIYANRLLDAYQLDLYNQSYKSLSSKVSLPVLVIYLYDEPAHCLERIKLRNRPYEQKIEISFLKTMSGDYDNLFAGWKTCPVIRIRVWEFDFREKENFDNLVNQIKCYVASNK